MTAPFPYDGIAGAATDPAEGEAANLHRQYCWIARLADEMNAEVELDLKRTMQLVFHCRTFRQWYDALQARIGQGHTQAQIGDILQGLFALKKCIWATRAAMLQDLQGIYDDAGTVSAWIEANAAQYKQGFSTNVVVNDQGDMSDTPIKTTKTTAIATRISTIRARFGARP